MRICAGRLRGRKLAAPEGSDVRPTAERTRAAIFDRLLNGGLFERLTGRRTLERSCILDGFAGTGAMGLEALSQGGDRALFIEHDPAALAALRANIANAGVTDRARVIAADLLTIGPSPAAADLVLLDPPYGRNLLAPALQKLLEKGYLAEPAAIVAECGRTEPVTPPAGIETVDERRYGRARIVFLRRATP